MGRSRLICLSALFPAIVVGQEIGPSSEIPLTPPGYKVLRFDEDNSCLTNQDNRTDLLDPVKYIPLRSDNPLWYLTFGGAIRERFEGNYDPDAVYGVPGQIAIPALSNAPSYIGTALDVNLNRQIQRHISLQASYVHFLTGS